jgi:hypothetical protein
MEPRIYTYKVTFEEIPDWYWGVHKEKKYGEPYLGSPKTHAWKWEFYTPHLEICELFPYTDEGWVEAQNVENRCIKPDLNNPFCLNEHYGSVVSLGATRRVHKEKDELGRSVHAVKAGRAAHEKKDELGRSVHAVKRVERMLAVTHAEKDELGRSVQGVKNAKRMCEKVHAKRDELGRSVHTLKAFKDVHTEKNEEGKSINAVSGGKNTASQRWMNTDPCWPPFISNPPGLTKWQRNRGIDTKNRVRVYDNPLTK